jgi:hypothetical protein
MPFFCSFCTIINVQGTQVASPPLQTMLSGLVPASPRHKFFITDDNPARNQTWEAFSIV